MRSENGSTGRQGSFIEAARRAQIIEAAIATVNETGYSGASLARIAKHAGISKSVILYHFADKEQLLLHLVEQVFARLGADVEAAIRVETTPTAKLAAYARSYLGHAARHREAMIAAIEIVVSHRTDDGVPLYLVEDENDTAALRAILGAGMASGEFRTADLDVVTTTVEHALDGALTRSQKRPDTDLAAWAEELIPVLLAALRPEKAADPHTGTTTETEPLPEQDGEDG